MTSIIPHVVSQHAEEAAFLWLLRANAVRAPHERLSTLARLDGRLEAHIDGLRIAGDAGWEIGVGELQHKGGGEVFVAAYLALERGNVAEFRAVTDVVTEVPSTAGGLISALAWVSLDTATARIGELLGSADPVLRSVGIAASTAHRQDPGVALTDGFTSAVPDLRQRAFAAVGRSGRHELAPALLNGLADPDPGPRYSAALSSAMFGDAGGALALRRIAEAPGPFREHAASVAGRFTSPEQALTWHRGLTFDPTAGRAACAAAGGIGDPVLVPWLIERMAIAELARAAGEAFSMITGADIAYADLDRKDEPRPEAGTTEDPSDPSVEPDPDGDLPFPEPQKIDAWWQSHQATMPKGRRYLLGRSISEEAARLVLRTGFQRQRIQAALELAIATGRPPFDVRAPGFVQKAQLAA